MNKGQTKIESSSNKRLTWNIWLNVLLLLLEIVSLVLILAVPLNLWGIETVGIESFKFYTTQSNLLLTLSTILVIIFTALVKYKKVKQVPVGIMLLKLMSTACTTVTMISVVLFTPFADLFDFGSRIVLFVDSNLFYHLICPTLAVVIFLLFENKTNIKLKQLWFCLIPTALYAIFYLSYAYSHMQPDWTIPKEYDWYGLTNFGVFNPHLPVVLALGGTFLFSWCLWLGNRKICLFKKKN